MGRTISLADHVDEIALAPPRARGGYLARAFGRVTELANGGRGEEGTLRATDSALLVRGPGSFEDGVEIPWHDVRKLVVDDGSRWGYVSGVCRFPVYDLRPDGSGSGVLIGPLWSNAAALLPEGCPVAELDPVPDQAPNVAVIFDPPLPLPEGARANGNGPEPEWISILLLRAEDPEAAREALGGRHAVGDIAHDDLEYLSQAARRPGHPSSGRSASAASA